MTVARVFWYSFYKLIARNLPGSNSLMGKVGKRFRYTACKKLFSYCGGNVNIEKGVRFALNSVIRIGDNSGIGVNALVLCSVTIGENVMMGQDVVIISSSHEFSNTEMPMIAQGFRADRTVEIGNDVWIGARAILLPGVMIGSGSIIGAGAVVSRDIPEWSVAAGNPARVVRRRK